MTALLSFNNTPPSLLSSNTTFIIPPYMPTSAITNLLTERGRSHDLYPQQGQHFAPADDLQRRRKHSRKTTKVKKSPDLQVTSHENFRHSVWWEEQQKKMLGLGGEEESKKRRSINSPAPGKPREAQLYNINKRSVVEVHSNGSISTTARTDSPYSIFRVFYLCSVFVIASIQNCSENLKFSERLYFVESQKYLCIDNRRNIYTDSSVNNTDCILNHEFLTNKYDIYYSNNYPRSLSRCQSTPRRSTTLTTTSSTDHRKTDKHHPTSNNIKTDKSSERLKKNLRWKNRKGSRLRACSSRWYLGVGVDDRLKIFMTGENRTKREMFFIQRWHYSKNMSYLSHGVVLEDGRGVNSTKMPDLRHSSKPVHNVSEDRQDTHHGESSHPKLTTDSITKHYESSSSSFSSSKAIPQNTSPTPTSSSFSTSSPLKRTRSFFLNSLKQKKDKGVECSNLLKTNCSLEVQQEATQDPQTVDRLSG